MLTATATCPLVTGFVPSIRERSSRRVTPCRPNCSRTGWGKNLGGGLAEFRVSEPSQEGEVVLRIFFHAFGDRRILIRHGYDKGGAPAGVDSGARSLKPNDG